MYRILLFASLCFFSSLKGLSQSSYLLSHGDTTLNPFYSTQNLTVVDTIRFRLMVHGAAPAVSQQLNFAVDNSSMGKGHELSLPAAAVSISHAIWTAATNNANGIDTFIRVTMPAFKDTLKKEEIARLYIQDHPDNYVLIRVVSGAAPAQPDTGKVSLGTDPKIIHAYTDDMQTPQIDTFKVAITVSGKYNPRFATLHYQIGTGNLPNKPQLVNNYINLSQTKWDSVVSHGGILYDNLYVLSQHVIDTGILASASASIKNKGRSATYGPDNTNKDKYNWYKKSNFVLISFIKSISGTASQSETVGRICQKLTSPKTRSGSGGKSMVQHDGSRCWSTDRIYRGR